jgi:hypothetical protein
MPVAPHLRVPALVVVALAALALPATATAAKAGSPKLPAKFQQRYHVKSAVADPDKDGLTNYTEYRAHTNPKKADSDRDGADDGAEDRDGDKLDNATEQRAGTNPAKRDSDGDGRADAREDADRDGLRNLAEQQTANDPDNPDSDDDGTRDGRENAGQVVSFEDGELALRLAATGKTVTATVDDETAVECNATDDYELDYDDSAAGDDAPADDAPADDATADEAASDDAPAEAAREDQGDGAASASVRLLSGYDGLVRAADDGTDPTAADEPEDAGDDTGDEDLCAGEVLTAGAWVHEAELSTGDDGSSLFDVVALVDDRS